MRPVSGSYWTLTPKKIVKTPHGPLMISPLASNLNPLDSSSIKDYKSCCARRKNMDFWETFLCKGETQISWQKSITTETISVKCRHQGPNKTLLKARRFFKVWAIISCNFAVGIFSPSFISEWVKTCSAELKELRQYERWLHMMMVAARLPSAQPSLRQSGRGHCKRCQRRKGGGREL